MLLFLCVVIVAAVLVMLAALFAETPAELEDQPDLAPELSSYVCVVCGELIPSGQVWEKEKEHDDTGLETFGGGTLTIGAYCPEHRPEGAWLVA